MLSRRLKLIAMFFFITQVLFSASSEVLFEKQNFFPLYNWNIFHTVPEKYLERYSILIHRVGHEALTPPVDLLELKESFPRMNTYSMTQKIHKLGLSIKNKQKDNQLALLKDINHVFSKEKKVVHWEIWSRTFDPIDFVKNKKTISKYLLGKYVSSP